MYLATEGMFQYEYLGSTETTYLVADCTLLKFSMVNKLSAKNTFNLSAGRFAMSDASSIIFSQTNDGILAQFKFARMNVSAYGGYTGLLNGKQVAILNAASSTYAYDSESVYPLAAPYAVAGATFTAPYLFANQTIGLQIYSFFGAADTTSGYNRLYGTVTLNGPLAANVFYTLTSTFGTDDMFTSVGNLSQIQLSIYPPFASSSITLSGVYASGNNGALSSFTGFTNNPATLALDGPKYAGLIKAGLFASIKPIEPLYFDAGADCVFGCPDSTVSYSGFQYYADARYQLFTDVQLSAGAQQYFDKDDKTNKISFTAKAVISF